MISDSLLVTPNKYYDNKEVDDRYFVGLSDSFRNAVQLWDPGQRPVWLRYFKQCVHRHLFC